MLFFYFDYCLFIKTIQPASLQEMGVMLKKLETKKFSTADFYYIVVQFVGFIFFCHALIFCGFLLKYRKHLDIKKIIYIYLFTKDRQFCPENHEIKFSRKYNYWYPRSTKIGSL